MSDNVIDLNEWKSATDPAVGYWERQFHMLGWSRERIEGYCAGKRRRVETY